MVGSKIKKRAVSSVGRAPHWRCGCQRFDSSIAHTIKTKPPQGVLFLWCGRRKSTTWLSLEESKSLVMFWFCKTTKVYSACKARLLSRKTEAMPRFCEVPSRGRRNFWVATKKLSVTIPRIFLKLMLAFQYASLAVLARQPWTSLWWMARRSINNMHP